MTYMYSNKLLFSTPPKTPAQQGFLVVVRHVVTKHRSDLLLSSNLQVRSNVILSRVSCTLQTRALVQTCTPGGKCQKDLHVFGG